MSLSTIAISILIIKKKFIYFCLQKHLANFSASHRIRDFLFYSLNIMKDIPDEED